MGPGPFNESSRNASYYLGIITVTSAAIKTPYMVPAWILVSLGGGSGYESG